MRKQAATPVKAWITGARCNSQGIKVGNVHGRAAGTIEANALVRKVLVAHANR